MNEGKFEWINGAMNIRINKLEVIKFYKWLNEGTHEWINEQKNEWMNEQTNEGMNVWMNEWKNECMKGWMNEWIFYSSILIFNIQFNKKKIGYQDVHCPYTNNSKRCDECRMIMLLWMTFLHKMNTLNDINICALSDCRIDGIYVKLVDYTAVNKTNCLLEYIWTSN